MTSLKILPRSLIVPLRAAVLGSTALTLMACSASADAETANAPPAPAVDASAGRSASVLNEGDRIQLVFYERLDVEDDKWRGRQGVVPRSFHQRTELTNTYVVEDGAVSMPMLGRFQAAGLEQDAFLARVGKAFDDLIERKGFVTLVSVEHPPVYVVGPVKNPGSFKYERGMTVLHAIALAGGVRSQEAEPWQRVEFGREVERLQRSLDKAKRLLARTAVIEAERDLASVRSADLGVVMGKAQAASLVNDEAWQRNLTTMSRDAQEANLVAAVTNARSEMQARAERMAPLDATLAMRAERVKNLTGLADRNVIGRPVVMQAQSEFADAQDRRHQALVENEGVRKRLDAAERELAKFRLEAKVELSRIATASRRDTVETLDDGQGVLDVVKALAGDRNGQNTGASFAYEIVRRMPDGTVVLPVADTATLMPGDLVRLRPPGTPSPAQSAEAAGSGTPIPARPVSEPLNVQLAPPKSPRGGTADIPVAARTVAQNGERSRTQ